MVSVKREEELNGNTHTDYKPADPDCSDHHNHQPTLGMRTADISGAYAPALGSIS